MVHLLSYKWIKVQTNSQNVFIYACLDMQIKKSVKGRHGVLKYWTHSQGSTYLWQINGENSFQIYLPTGQLEFPKRGLASSDGGPILLSSKAPCEIRHMGYNVLHIIFMSIKPAFTPWSWDLLNFHEYLKNLSIKKKLCNCSVHPFRLEDAASLVKFFRKFKNSPNHP